MVGTFSKKEYFILKVIINVEQEPLMFIEF